MFTSCHIQSITAYAPHVSLAQVLVLTEVLALQGIPDEYDEADINRLFSGKVLHMPLGYYLSCLHHTELLSTSPNNRFIYILPLIVHAMAGVLQMTAGSHP